MSFRRFVLLLLAIPLLAGGPSARARLKPFRTDTPPVLDGRLDDPLWAQAASVTDFETFIPEFGKKQPEKTVAYMAYDTQNLYFAFRCSEEAPDRIRAPLTRRDDIGTSDFVCINLDTFNDQQSLYAFYVTPAGVQGDSRFASNKEDFSVDLVWDCAARIDAQGYSVEIRIPLKSIRYLHGDKVQMAVFFERTIHRRQEHGSFPALDPARGYAFLPQMAVLEYEGFARPTTLELLPAFTLSRRSVREEGLMRRQPDDRQWSLTGKYGITPSLVLDATVNPDFSQVEADAAQVDANLRSSLYLPERRPFFLEGSEAFNVAATQTSPLQAVLHSRTIVDPRWGLKLSGKVGRDDTLALLAAVDTPDPAGGGGGGPRSAVFRYRRTTSEDGYLGAFYAARDGGPRSNRVFGPDGQIRLTDASLLSFHAFASSTHGDASLESSRGRALGLEYLFDTSRLAVNGALHDITRDFIADAGFLTRTGLSSASVLVTPKVYPRSGWLRRLDPFVGYSSLRDHLSGLREGNATAGLTFIFQGNGAATFQREEATEIFLGQRFRTDRWRASARSQVTKSLSFQASYQRGLGIRYTSDPFQGRVSQTALGVVVQPGESFNLALNWTFADFYRMSTGEKIYSYPISRAKLTYQFSHAFFLRAIVEQNRYRRQLLTDLLASYTYIPGTVLYLGYGSLARQEQWDGGQVRPADPFLEVQRGLFFKASYLWRY
ncbi:MAG: carbohydrate binding family 9 domain-containing protein [Acidobacteria bacterium]|nr:carbohydrate binding family 9 domain-containing protein [Acidobacteriota bacterium]